MDEEWAAAEVAAALDAEDDDVVAATEEWPDMHALFCHYSRLYFDDMLGACSVHWSSGRMTLCAGVCEYTRQGGCRIKLSEPLLKYRPLKDMKETLLHEMIHAYLFLTHNNTDHNDHGPNFQAIMNAINTSSVNDYMRPRGGYHVTIYHSFRDEVNNYRTHHWKCEKCGEMVKRAMNRAPSAKDCMQLRRARGDGNATCTDSRCNWHTHERTCGGAFVKVAEPPGYKDKKRKAQGADTVASTSQAPQQPEPKSRRKPSASDTASVKPITDFFTPRNITAALSSSRAVEDDGGSQCEHTTDAQGAAASTNEVRRNCLDAVMQRWGAPTTTASAAPSSHVAREKRPAQASSPQDLVEACQPSKQAQGSSSTAVCPICGNSLDAVDVEAVNSHIDACLACDG
eukprot:jgi/Chlat1/725/Chrsp104S01201